MKNYTYTCTEINELVLKLIKMKLQHFKSLLLFGVMAVFLSACGGLGKMAKYANDITYQVDPEPLIVRGDSVELNVTGKFPGKYFHKKAIVDMTPSLKYAEGETDYKTVTYQGEKAAGNGIVVPYENGKEYSYNDKVAYSAAMEQSEVLVNFTGKVGNKSKEFDPIKIADGVITTPYLMMADDKVLLGKDAFQRITNHDIYAQINYLVNSSHVRGSELNEEDIKAMRDFINEVSEDEKMELTSLVIDAYASPEGEISLNENLADDRAKSASAVVEKELKRRKIEAEGSFYSLNGKGEDWAGFQEAMEASDIEDKELILRILNMYEDVSKREEEIRNLAATYNEIADHILPDLRRSQMTLNYKITGKTDEQILSLAKTAPDSLNVEEILYAATLTDDVNEQLQFYKEAEANFPQDFRGANNVGYIYMLQNKLNDAEAQFIKANEIQENPYSTNNLGVIARLKGDREKAMEHYENATSAGPEVSYNMGIINIQNGNYTKAISNMGSTNSFNAALAKVLNGNAQGAKSTLEAAPEKDTAKGQYLMAIIGARLADGGLVKSSLESAYSEDNSLKAKAAKDLEFRDYQEAVQ